MITLITLAPTGPSSEDKLPIGVRPMPTRYELALGRSGDLMQVSLHVHTLAQAEQLLTAAQSIRDGLRTREQQRKVAERAS